jgi:hypothetical protein
MRPVLTALLLGLAGCGACAPDKSPPPAPSTVPSAAPSSLLPRVPSSLPRASSAPKLACRVITLDGEATLEVPGQDGGTTPLLLQGLAPTEAWVDLAKGSRVVVRDPRTTRETTFHGPARVRACVGFTEESWIAAGGFESTVGAGESPGAEEWVVTPAGVVRYAAAKLSVGVSKSGADATLESGVAFAWWADTPDAGANVANVEEGWVRLPAGKTHLSLPPGDSASAAVTRCALLASSARALAAQVMVPGGGADGGTIMRQVTMRRLARAACAVATLRVTALPPAEAAPLLRPVAEAHTAWSGMPVSSPY